MQASEITMTVKRVRHRSSKSAESAKSRQRSESVTELVGLGRVRRGPAEFSLVSPASAGRIRGVPTSLGQSFPESRSPNQSTEPTARMRPPSNPFPRLAAAHL